MPTSYLVRGVWYVNGRVFWVLSKIVSQEKMNTINIHKGKKLLPVAALATWQYKFS